MGRWKIRQATLILALTVALLLATACRDEQSDYSGYLPPCSSLEGSSSDPCLPDASQIWGQGEASSVELLDEPRGLDIFLNLTRAHISHQVVRATYLPGTVRCTTNRGSFRPAAYQMEVWEPLSPYGKSVRCYADLRVNEYILGSGPTTLTVQFERDGIGAREPHREEELRILFEQKYSSRLTNPIEAIFFIGPAIDIQAEVLRVFETWDLEREDDGTVVAVHPFGHIWEYAAPDDYQTYLSTHLKMELPAFRQAVTAAHQARLTAYGGRAGPDPTWPMLETNANRLTQFYTTIGAYSHPDGPPMKPPPACGLALPTGGYNSGLMRDCQALLAGKETLAGTATLNWDTGTAITGWDGVTIAGTPARVTKVLLDDEDLTGTIPPQMGDLSELTHLDLSDNSLTGQVPRPLGNLDNLVEVRLSGNSLTGCIPYGLKDVQTNDLASLNLLYCPPAPAAPTGGTAGETSLPLSWTAVANTTKYRVQYRQGKTTLDRWILDDESITGTSHTVDGLQCEQEHEFRVFAYGDGTTYAAAWSTPSEPLRATTGSCTPPVFAAESYSFDIPDDAAVVGATVGTISASDGNGGPVTYGVKGTTSATFPHQEFLAVDEQTGVITLIGDMSEYEGHYATLWYVAQDQTGGESEPVEVSIVVTES